MNEAHRQSGFRLRLDWGPVGAEAIVPGCDVAVVVDVLSFTTTLSVAADRGATVFPFPWRGERAARFAAERDAVLAVGRRSQGSGVSLSPGSVRTAPELRRLVLPSPNGSTISARLADGGATVIGMGLRNRAAVARWLLARRPGTTVAVVAAGERWPDGSLRPAVEDLWGGGALVAALLDGGWSGASPEALAAAAAFTSGTDVRAVLHDCAGGRELAAIGFAGDVDVAAELDTSPSVPVLGEEAFTTAG